MNEWMITGLVLMSPIWVYIIAKMVTFGILKARRQFQEQTESEEKNGSESSRKREA